MNFGSINWLAVVVCVVVSMIVGSIWFSEKVFFPVWWQAIGRSKSDTPGMSGGSNMVKTFGLTILASFVQAVFMSLFITAMGSTTLVSGALAGFLLWLGFVAPSSLTNKVFAGQLKALVLEAGNHLVTYVLFGAILGAWR